MPSLADLSRKVDKGSEPSSEFHNTWCHICNTSSSLGPQTKTLKDKQHPKCVGSQPFSELHSPWNLCRVWAEPEPNNNTPCLYKSGLQVMNSSTNQSSQMMGVEGGGCCSCVRDRESVPSTKSLWCGTLRLYKFTLNNASNPRIFYIKALSKTRYLFMILLLFFSFFFISNICPRIMCYWK